VQIPELAQRKFVSFLRSASLFQQSATPTSTPTELHHAYSNAQKLRPLLRPQTVQAYGAHNFYANQTCGVHNFHAENL